MRGYKMSRDDTLSPLSNRMQEIDAEVSELQKSIYKLKDEKNLLITKYAVENTRTLEEMRNNA